MKTIFDTRIKEEIFARIDRLRPDSKPMWGSMNVNQNLRHMGMLFEIAMAKYKASPSFVPPMPKWLLRLILLYIKMPKGKIKTLKEMNVIENNIDPKDFDKERDSLKNLIDELTRSNTFAPEHTIGGKFSRKDWGKFTYKHTDYHLKQFGV
jgi:hypothetical protein